MTEVSVGPARSVRTLVWSVAGLAVAVVVAAGLFVLSQVFRALGESFCSTETRFPPDARGASGPTFVDPVHLRCDYGRAGTRVFTDTWPALEVAAVVGAVLGAVGILLWCAWRLTAGLGDDVSGKVDNH